MGRKKSFWILWLTVTTIALSFLLMCCMWVMCFDVDPFYELDRPCEDAMEIQRQALGKQYSCLKFVDGLLIHGKDTSTVAKYIVDRDEASWTELSNRIYVVTVLNPAHTFVLQDGKFSMSDVGVKMLAENNETVCEEFACGGISLYMSHANDGAFYLYIEGVRIPGRVDDRNTHFKKRAGK